MVLWNGCSRSVERVPSDVECAHSGFLRLSSACGSNMYNKPSHANIRLSMHFGGYERRQRPCSIGINANATCAARPIAPSVVLSARSPRNPVLAMAERCRDLADLADLWRLPGFQQRRSNVLIVQPQAARVRPRFEPRSPARGLCACAWARRLTKIHERPLPRVPVGEDHESREEKEVGGHSKLRPCAQPQQTKATAAKALSAPYHARIVIIAWLFRGSLKNFRQVEIWPLSRGLWRMHFRLTPQRRFLGHFVPFSAPKSQSRFLVVRQSLTAWQAVLRVAAGASSQAVRCRVALIACRVGPGQANPSAARWAHQSTGKRVSTISLFAVRSAGCLPPRIAATMSGAR
jgi:hypothetical protein